MGSWSSDLLFECPFKAKVDSLNLDWLDLFPLAVIHDRKEGTDRGPVLLQDDVNAVAFADETSNVILSGSDDKLCKVRSMGFQSLLKQAISSSR
jgi:hypothetical protein